MQFTVVTVFALHCGNSGCTFTVGTVAALYCGTSGYSFRWDGGWTRTVALSLWQLWLHSHCGDSGCSPTAVPMAVLSLWSPWLHFTVVTVCACYCVTSGCTITVITVAVLCCENRFCTSLW